MHILSKILTTTGLALAVAMPTTAVAKESTQPEMTVYRDIDYIDTAEYADARDLLDVFMPVNASDTPVVVFFHGGGLLQGDKGQGEYLANALVPRGIGVVSANYRLSPRV